MGDTVPGARDGDCCIAPKRTSSLAFCESTYELKCAESLQPRIGMVFESWEDGKAFYERYAHEVGFSVRTYTQHKGEGGVPVWKRFVCADPGGGSYLGGESSAELVGSLHLDHVCEDGM